MFPARHPMILSPPRQSSYHRKTQFIEAFEMLLYLSLDMPRLITNYYSTPPDWFPKALLISFQLVLTESSHLRCKRKYPKKKSPMLSLRGTDLFASLSHTMIEAPFPPNPGR